MRTEQRWFIAITSYITALRGITKIDRVRNFQPKARPVARIFDSLLEIMSKMVSSYSWSQHTLTPHEAQELEEYVNKVLLPLINEAKGDYIERRRREEFSTSATSEHPSRETSTGA